MSPGLSSSAAGVIPAGVCLRGCCPAGEGAERPGRGRDQGDDRVRVSGPGQGQGDLPGGLAGGWVGEAAGDLDGGVSVAWRCRHAERLEPIARVADDVPGCDLPGGCARLGRLAGQGGGEFGDPLDRCGFIRGLRCLAAAGGARGGEDGGDGRPGMGAEFVFGGGCQAAFADGAEGGIRRREPHPDLRCLHHDLAAGRGQPGTEQVIDLRPGDQPGAPAVCGSDLDAQAGGLGRDGFPGSGIGLARRPFSGIRRELAAGRFQGLAVVDRAEQVTDHEGGKAADAEEDVVVGERDRGAGRLRQSRRFRCAARPGPGAGGGSCRRVVLGRGSGGCAGCCRAGQLVLAVSGRAGAAGRRGRAGFGSWPRCRGHDPAGLRGTAGQGFLRGARAPVHGAGVVQLGG